MSDHTSQSEDSRPSASDLSPAEETRAAIDVMFEALAHIQASLETSSEEAREASYRNFKQALYRRYGQVLEDRQAEGAPQQAPQAAPEPSVSVPGADGADSGDASVPGESGSDAGGDGFAVEQSDDDSDGSDTLEKFWPAVSKNVSK